jgi:hypothetical protein
VLAEFSQYPRHDETWAAGPVRLPFSNAGFAFVSAAFFIYFGIRELEGMALEKISGWILKHWSWQCPVVPFPRTPNDGEGYNSNLARKVLQFLGKPCERFARGSAAAVDGVDNWPTRDHHSPH